MKRLFLIIALGFMPNLLCMNPIGNNVQNKSAIINTMAKLGCIEGFRNSNQELALKDILSQLHIMLDYEKRLYEFFKSIKDDRSTPDQKLELYIKILVKNFNSAVIALFKEAIAHENSLNNEFDYNKILDNLEQEIADNESLFFNGFMRKAIKEGNSTQNLNDRPVADVPAEVFDRYILIVLCSIPSFALFCSSPLFDQKIEAHMFGLNKSWSKCDNFDDLKKGHKLNVEVSQDKERQLVLSFEFLDLDKVPVINNAQFALVRQLQQQKQRSANTATMPAAQPAYSSNIKSPILHGTSYAPAIYRQPIYMPASQMASSINQSSQNRSNLRAPVSSPIGRPPYSSGTPAKAPNSPRPPAQMASAMPINQPVFGTVSMPVPTPNFSQMSRPMAPRPMPMVNQAPLRQATMNLPTSMAQLPEMSEQTAGNKRPRETNTELSVNSQGTEKKARMELLNEAKVKLAVTSLLKNLSSRLQTQFDPNGFLIALKSGNNLSKHLGSAIAIFKRIGENLSNNNSEGAKKVFAFLFEQDGTFSSMQNEECVILFEALSNCESIEEMVDVISLYDIN